MAAPIDVFMSAGRTSNPTEEAFVQAVEESLRAEGLNPRSIGRTDFSYKQPLHRIWEVMNECSGAVILAYERTYIESGVEKKATREERRIDATSVTTVWNHIEAAMAYTLNLPIFVVMDRAVREEGLLEKGYDWFVLTVDIAQQPTNTKEFRQIITGWRQDVEKNHDDPRIKGQQASFGKDSPANLESLPAQILLRSLTVKQVIGILGFIAAVVSAAYGAGASHILTAPR